MSTELALLTQKEFILNGFENKELTLGIFVDYSKAFNRLNHQTLFTKLEHYGFREISSKLLQSYLNHRKQLVSISSQDSHLREITQGVPQGSILGPVLFNIYTNDIVNISNDANFIIYADDTSLLFQSRNIGVLSFVANATLKQLAEWSKVNALKLNTAKTKAVIFAPPQKQFSENILLQVGSEVIELVPNVKTLGVIFNEKLMWNEHVELIASRLAKACGVLCRLRETIASKVKLILYNALFSSHLMYCHLVWGTTSKHNITKLFLQQKKAVRQIANAPFVAHTSELLSKFNIICLPNLYEVNLALKYQSYFKYNNEAFLGLCNLTEPTGIS